METESPPMPQFESAKNDDLNQVYKTQVYLFGETRTAARSHINMILSSL